MRTALDGAHALREALAAHGGAAAAALADPIPDAAAAAHRPPLSRPGPAQIAAAGPRAHGQEREYELLVEMILEGYRLHYGEPLVVRTPDPDLALLLGDQLYALGLSRLAELGDLDAVAELADVISLAAQAHTASDPDLTAQAHTASDPDLAEAIWEAGAVAVGWGTSDAHLRAKQRARGQHPDAPSALRAATAARRYGAL